MFRAYTEILVPTKDLVVERVLGTQPNVLSVNKNYCNFAVTVRELMGDSNPANAVPGTIRISMVSVFGLMPRMALMLRQTADQEYSLIFKICF